MSELQDYIPDDLKDKIKQVASEKEFCPVYRVDKSGTHEESFLASTYEEFSPIYSIEKFNEKYPLDDIGSYSTSVYDKPNSCERFILSMGEKVRKKYPHPVVMVGYTQGGLAVHTVDYKQKYKDKTHIDWWIYKGHVLDALPYFKEYVADE